MEMCTCPFCAAEVDPADLDERYGDDAEMTACPECGELVHADAWTDPYQD